MPDVGSGAALGETDVVLDVESAAAVEEKTPPALEEKFVPSSAKTPESVPAQTSENLEVDGMSSTVVEEVKEVSKLCLACKKVCLKITRCKECKSGCYCSRTCRKKHAETHLMLCKYIQELELIERSKQVFSVRVNGQVEARNRLVRLVGERPTLDCMLNNERSCALWDTGAMVSMVSKDWLDEKMPDEVLLSISEFLEGDKLHLVAANKSEIDIVGVVILAVRIGDFSVPVPFVVTRDALPQPKCN